MISSLFIDLEVSHASVENEYVAIHCIEGAKTIRGSFKIICDTILLFSEGVEEVSLDELQEIAQQYWEGFSHQENTRLY